MEFTHSVPLNVPTADVNLADWVFTLTDEEYRACSKGHHAMGIIGGEMRLGVINVEQIAGTLIVQHYYTKQADRQHVRFESEASEGFLLRTVPFVMKVWWDMRVEPRGEASTFTCTIGFDAPAWVEAAGAVVRNGHQLHEHLVEETGNFGKDIERKRALRAP